MSKDDLDTCIRVVKENIEDMQKRKATAKGAEATLVWNFEKSLLDRLQELEAKKRE
jgi:hypothetical protein